MGIFDRFPYSSTHEMNLDFMLGKATEIAESLQEIDTHKDQAEHAATNAAQSAQSAAQAAQAAAGSATAAEQHKADAEDAADRAETAWNGADESAEQAAQAATQAVQTALNNTIGNLSNLTTEDKTNIVNAINAVSNRIITPEMYGAKGDGVTDDTNALRACIQNNAFVFLKGTYLISGVLTFNNISNLTWYGGKITRPANTTFNTICGSSANNISLVNITFEGNGNNRETQYTWIDNVQGCIILASQCKNISIEKCKIKNFNYGIFILGADVENAPVSFDNISMNGVIRDCVFHNVNSAIDTYGKGISIEHNMFYECTDNTVQIETVGDGFTTLNPLTDPSFASSAVSITICDNLFISNSQYDIIIFKNSYSINICNNTFMNYTRGILLNQILSNAVVDSNTFVYQNRTNIVPDANTRPWADTYPTSILCTGEGVIITNNVINNAVNGITIKGPCIVKNNTINNPWICGMIMFYATDQIGKAAMITGNKIINHILNTEAWWGSYACVMESGDAVFTDNVIESNTTPIRAPASSTKMHVSNILTKPAFSGTITQLDYLFPYSNTQA